MIIRCRILLLTLVALMSNAGWALAQSASYSPACLQAFAPLREEAQNRAALIKAASERHAPAAEACKLVGDFARSEIRMIEFLERNSKLCDVPQQTADQLKVSHRNTEVWRTKICRLAQQGSTGRVQQDPTFGPPGPVGDFWILR